MLLLTLLVAATAVARATDQTFAIENNTFLLNGKSIQVMSGSIHYSRVKPSLWRDRLQRLKAMGLNAVQTYVMWNFHEANPGEFDFTGDRDLSQFLQICAEEDLLVLLRLGPYSCGEWEFGGFPAFIIGQQDPPVQLRTYEAGYIALVDRWWAELLPVVKPHLMTNGGNVVMVQVENEYGSYGDVSKNPNDLKYMHHLVDLVHMHLGNNSVQIYTTDGGNTGYMSRGTLNGSIVYTVGDHGPSSDTSNCEAMKQYNAIGKSPCMDSEYYTGWLTHWGDSSLANTSSKLVAQWIDDILTNNGSFNLYMGHGGTSFGFWSGSNGGGSSFSPDITSYDYDSPVSEGGEHGYGSDAKDKFVAIQNVLRRHQAHQQAEGAPLSCLSSFIEPPLPPRYVYPDLMFTMQAVLLENLVSLQPLGGVIKYPAKTTGDQPPSMESIGQNYGFLLYETDYPSNQTTNQTTNQMTMDTIGFTTFPRDRAHVFVDDVVAISTPMYRPTYNKSVPVSIGGGSGSKPKKLQVLMENLGRLNYGAGMYDPKGFANGETLLWNDRPIGMQEWTTWSLPMETKQLERLSWKKTTTKGDDASSSSSSSSSFTPTFYRAEMVLGGDSDLKVGDTYVVCKGWTKGSIFINGNNLGRYWESLGPQRALYIPAEFWLVGSNEIILLELEKRKSLSLSLSFSTTF